MIKRFEGNFISYYGATVKNSIVYDDDFFMVKEVMPDMYSLLYVGKDGRVPQPIGCTTYQSMFEGRQDIHSLDLSEWDTSLVDDFSCMFMNDINLVEVKGVEDWNTSSGRSFDSTFCGCSSLKALNLNKWDLKKAETITGMFCECYDLEKLDVSEWNTISLKDASMFIYGCTNLKTIDVSKWCVENLSMAENFACSCVALSYVGVENWYTPNLIEYKGMLNNCLNLPELNLDKLGLSEYAISKIFFCD
jgi:surface protein